MVEYAGKTLVRAHERVAGRLCFAKNGYAPTETEGTKIVFWDGECDLSEAFLRFAVGMVLPDCAEHSAKEKASRLGIPVLTVGNTADISDGSGKHLIAVLDTAVAKLYIDPDIETVRTLLCEKMRRENAEIPKLAVCSNELMCVPHGFDGLVGKTLNGSEESAYEYLCELADRNTGSRIVAALHAGGGADKVTALVRAAYRAGVWGRFSILFCGIRLPDEASVCVEALHRAYRELDAASREFNGFIPKGMAIETPLMLMCPDKLSAFDFFCLDADKLAELFGGGAEKEYCAPYIVRYAETFALRYACAPIAVMSGEKVPLELTNKLRELCIGSELYVKIKNI